MHEAITHEMYERAGEIRDHIHKIESGEEDVLPGDIERTATEDSGAAGSSDTVD